MIKHKQAITVVFVLVITIATGSSFGLSTNYPEREKLEDLSHCIESLSQQVMLQQFFQEQYVRSDGKSGLHLVRQRRSGSKNYFVETHNGYAAGSIHDHSNNIRTVGLGQFSAVLNGVHFHTRHNDYRLRMPHRTSKNYHDTEPIPFPDVPPEVTGKTTVEEQITEMRKWFKAWQTEDHSTRDYRKYFKPVLCYLEGGWTHVKKNVEESFHSDRHHIDAKTWADLHDKERFTAYSGSKSRLENLAFLPTKIIDVQNGRPVYAQWSYRILCHPLKKYLSVRKLNLVEDLSSRMMTGYNVYRHFLSKAARFQLESKGAERFVSGRDLLDELMEQIPGKDNYQGRLKNVGFDSVALNEDGTPKDVSRYHRWYKIGNADAMGSTNIHRGFSDDAFFAAMTTQKNIAAMNITHCKDNLRLRGCKHVAQKWTYAIPLEIIYLTPLSRWNPYGLKYHGDHVKGNPATLNRRYGHCNPKLKRELNGTNSKRFYQTPDAFFDGGTLDRTKADTTRFYACVLDPSGKSRRVHASGTYVVLPYIKDVGLVRQRYPIFPVKGEGSSVSKELNALRDIFMNPDRYSQMMWNSHDTAALRSETADITLVLARPRSRKIVPHQHYLKLSKQELIQIKGGKEVYKTTSSSSGHVHSLTVRWDRKHNTIFYHRCDKKYLCSDFHPRILYQNRK